MNVGFIIIICKDQLIKLKAFLKLKRFKFQSDYKIISADVRKADCQVLNIIKSANVLYPKCFAKQYRQARKKKISSFDEAKVYMLKPENQAFIHRSRFLKIKSNEFIDVGRQSNQPYPYFDPELSFERLPSNVTVLMPWGEGQAGFGDFMIIYLPVLSRMLDAIHESIENNVIVCLPHFQKYHWAVDLIATLGIEKEQIWDESRNLELTNRDSVILASPRGKNKPITHPDDIRSMRSRMGKNVFKSPEENTKKIYISRKTGRKMLNEHDLVDGLLERGFEIHCLEEYDVQKQIKLFQQARIIVGPHGAGHANIIWSPKGTHLIEVFHPAWMHPCYSLMAQVIGIHYHCIVGHHGRDSGSWTEDSRLGIRESPSVDPETLFKIIDEI